MTRVLGRVSLYGAAVLLSLWVLVPIYFITLAAFSSTTDVYRYPKKLVPTGLSTANMDFFLHTQGIRGSLERSVWVAAVTLVISLAIGTPAGYAIARFAFRGADSFRIGTASSTYLRTVSREIPNSLATCRCERPSTNTL